MRWRMRDGALNVGSRVRVRGKRCERGASAES
jgi:hypothetical protein